ncbi:hypothetical protein M9H77_35715 [Catharanthus roseus]|uniref:Uncharacterized protein n=1 Tax=Catharanthus roseus TaxID=4058 RepID=A0ACB9ZQJ9_CATRO|nr:hypothetical protein M9H77_35715 [Catharanthus roseus]
MDSEIRDPASLLDQISTRPISKVKEMRQIAKGELSPGSDSSFGSQSSFDFGSGSHGKADCHELLGIGVVADFVFGEEHQWHEVRRRMIFYLEHTMNMYLSLFRSVERVYELIRRTQWRDGHAPPEHWLDIPDSLYVIENAFNLYHIASTLVTGHLAEQQYFIKFIITCAKTKFIFLLSYATTNVRWMPIVLFTDAMGISL